MSHTRIDFLHLFYVLLALSISSLVHARDKANTDPTNPAAPTTELHYYSVFTDYQSFSEERNSSWREVNERVTASDEAAPNEHQHGATPKE